MHKFKANAKKLTEAEENKLKSKATKILEFARSEMIDDYPFIGAISMSLNLIPIRDVRVETACTDGANIYFDIDFLSKLDNGQIKFVLGHEIMHCVMNHMFRKETRDMMLWNIASDIEVNEMLKLDGFKLIDNICTAKSCGVPKDKSAEEYYNLLLNYSSEQLQDNTNNQFDKHIFETNNNGQNASNYNETNDGKSSDANNKCKVLADKFGQLGYDKDFKPRVCEEIADKIKDACVQAAQSIERQRGNLPGHYSKLVSELLEPIINWRDILQEYMTKIYSNRCMWNKPNRRFAYSHTFLPSREDNSMNIAIGLDTSGSCYEYIKAFVSEVFAITQQYKNYNIRIIQCDTNVTNDDVYNSNNGKTFDPNTFKASGFGGTELYPIMEQVVKPHEEMYDDETNLLIMFTDGECETFTPNMAPDGMNVIWIICGSRDEYKQVKDKFEFGQVVHYGKNI